MSSRARNSRQEGDHLDQLFSRQLQGKRFSCTECGKCCSGTGEVWMSTAEASRIADHLRMPFEQFLDLYCWGGSEDSTRQYAGWHQLVSKPGPEQNSCIFLDGKLCSIHAVRPGQCSQYPWWPELMAQAEWEAEKSICEGLDHPDAKVLDLMSAAQQLKQSTQQLQMRMLSRRVSLDD